MTGPSHATPDVEQPAPQPAPVEPVGAAVAPVPLMVGHAEDRAESDADARADSALSRLRRLEGETHTHGPGCDHSTISRGEVRRSAAPPSGAPVVGYEGGALDSGTSDAIESRRGSGRALDADVRRRMETAFNTSFSSVRIHDDSQSAKLNSAVSATAFTTGKDIFFGQGAYAPNTAQGDKVLAHELAHTLQPDGGAARTVAPGVSPRAHAAIVRSVATTHTVRRGIFDSIFGKKKPAQAPAPAPAAAAKPAAAPSPPPGFKGKGGALPSTAAEGAKGGIVGGVVGGAGAAGQFGSAAAPMLGGLTGGAAGLLTTADAMMGLNNADDMAAEAADYGDAGMWNLAGRKGKNQGMQALTGAASMAKGGVEMGYLASAGSANVAKSMAAGAGNATLGVAAGGLGVAVGSLQTAQGLWRSGKAVQKLCRLAWGRSKEMYSERGKSSWKPAVLSAEKFKLGVGIVKTALGVLGIAAGALLIVSNPIGWGIGIAAAIAGGVYAAGKIAAKISDAKNRTRIAEKIANGDDADVIVGEGTTKTVGEAKKSAASKTTQSNKRSDKKHPDGEKGADEHHARNAAIERANEVARLASSTAVVASEMRDRMLWADDNGNQRTWQLLEKAVGGNTKTAAEDQNGLDMTWASESDKELFDAYMLLSSINVSREEAVSPMGQELIEKKLSKMESM
ncbi:MULTISPECIES: DUF4157 domain-containing protein [unclassified Nocardioides]|uniref:eCIS core domain-containing protein n=1 Tax=unclassified Nocardioides TaxID=2615069 RepID=UPI000A4ADCB4|nr:MULTISPECIES: DUF4157 domain-containing protein [unclassified Nocardioides]